MATEDALDRRRRRHSQADTPVPTSLAPRCKPIFANLSSLLSSLLLPCRHLILTSSSFLHCTCLHQHNIDTDTDIDIDIPTYTSPIVTISSGRTFPHPPDRRRASLDSTTFSTRHSFVLHASTTTTLDNLNFISFVLDLTSFNCKTAESALHNKGPPVSWY